MALNLKKYEVKTADLRWNCPKKILKEKIDSDILASPVIGQERALKALRLGLNIKQSGYHIFVTGFPGTGRHTAIKYLLNEIKQKQSKAPDWCFVYNYKNPNRPIALSFPAGESQQFQRDIDDLIEYLKKKISNLFGGEFYSKKNQEILTDFEKRKSRRLQNFETQVVKSDLSLEKIQTGAYTQFILSSDSDGKTVAVADIDSGHNGGAAEPVKTTLPEKQAAFVHKLSDILQKVRLEEQDMKDRLRQLDQELVLPLLLQPFANLKKKYPDPKILAYLDAMQKDLLENLSIFPRNSENGHPDKERALNNALWRYKVNIVQDNSGSSNPPVVYEESPTLINLFGTIERDSQTDDKKKQPTYQNICSGSLLEANGGYLIINLSNISNVHSMWHRLKQVLKTKSLVIEPNYYTSESPVSTLRPEPIPIDLQVILIGEDYHYYNLYEHDNDFINIFKIRADFDTIAQKTNHAIRQYSAFLQKLSQDEDMLSFTPSGLARIIEEAVRIAGWRNKITTEMTIIMDLAREANHWAETENAKAINQTHVEIALSEKKMRLNLIEERIRERMLDGYTMLNLSGSEIGQINSLVIREDAEHQYGKPNRLTVRSSMGRSGIVNIERDSDFSGRSHTKGISILKGYFRALYAQDKELNFTASICFEQSYSRIDGDSASAAEVFALLSSLGDVPIRQDIAVTGSINQFGEIQPIGGVNEKIEGFFDLCREIGLTGTQGVIIPFRNLMDLQLHQEIIEAVKQEQFHIYAINTINEGLEILSGLKAGNRDKRNRFPKGSVHYFVDEKLRELNQHDKEDEH